MTSLAIWTAGTSQGFGAAFWPQFWSALVTAALVTVSIGYYVSIQVSRYEERARLAREAITDAEARKQQHLDDLQAIGTLKQRLCDALASTSKAVLVDAGVMGAAPSKAKAIAPIILEHSGAISGWYKSVPEEQAFLNAMKEVQERWSGFCSTATDLDTLLRIWIRTHNFERGAIAANDASYITFTLGRILELEPNSVIRYTQFNATNLDELTNIATQALSHADIQPLIEPYKASWGQLMDVTEKLATIACVA